MLKAKLSSYYRKSALVMIFVYIVTGLAEELAKFKTTQGAFYRENEAGQPLFFSTRVLSTNRNEIIPLTITTNGRVVADDLTKVLSQAEKLDEYILQERAKLMAKAAMGQSNAIEHLANATATREVATAEDIADAENVNIPVGEVLPV